MLHRAPAARSRQGCSPLYLLQASTFRRPFPASIAGDLFQFASFFSWALNHCSNAFIFGQARSLLHTLVASLYYRVNVTKYLVMHVVLCECFTLQSDERDTFGPFARGKLCAGRTLSQKPVQCPCFTAPRSQLRHSACGGCGACSITKNKCHWLRLYDFYGISPR